MMRLFSAISLSLLLISTSVVCAFAQEETVCIQCHGGQSGRLAVPVAEWRQSIHSANGISCHDCHGGDPSDIAMAMSPDRGFIGVPDYVDVPDFCGRCHIGVQQVYDESAHGQAVAQGGAQCVMCHNAHAVNKAEINLINEEACSRCHDYGRAGEIKESISGVEQMIAGIESNIERLHRIGIATDSMEGGLFDLRNRYRRLFHTVDVDVVRAETAGFQKELTEIEQNLSEIDATLVQRKIWGGVAVGLLFLGGVVSMLIRRTYHDEEGH